MSNTVDPKSVKKNWPKVAVVVLNWNAWDLTERSLDSVSKLHYPNYEVILVDNASTAAQPAGFKGKVSGLAFVQTKTNLGYTGGNNAGIRLALQRGADFVLILNNDVLAEDPKLLMRLVTLCKDIPSTGIAAPCVIQYNHDGKQIRGRYYSRVQALLSLVLGDRTLISGEVNLSSEEEAGLPNPLESSTTAHMAIEDVTHVCGCAMLISRTALERVGCFDERLFMYDDEYDLCLRVRAAGFNVLLLNTTTVTRLNVCHENNMPAYRTYLIGRNRFLVARKVKRPLRFVVFISFHIISSIKLAALLLRHRRWRHLKALVVGFRDGLLCRWGVTPQLRILLNW